ncbi:MAG TPA: DUF4442 domain-containing protein [Ferruginibacter sp.]|nr:DUF4442 domain-containing protein [Ferruginibacter sp.]HMP21398.1 DUF4442 domain-containing protein [Ferruginibacter sp.]
MTTPQQQFTQLLQHPLKLRLFLLLQLPSAFFSGVRVKSFDPDKAVVTVPYRWFSKNPFRSTYFACLAMAAEMSTGLLGMLHTYKSQPAVSMLVTGLEAVYHKKATGITSFTCSDGAAIAAAISGAKLTGEATSFKAYSKGVNEDGDLVAEFYITWSYKIKKQHP